MAVAALLLAQTAAAEVVGACQREAATARVIGRPSPRVAWRVVLGGSTPVYAALPRGGTRARGSVRPADAESLLVLGAARDRRDRCWLRVRLPSGPNRAHGWIRARRGVVLATPWRLIVSTRARSLELLRAGRLVHRWPIVVGAAATPTPHGTFAIIHAVRWRPHEFLGSWVLPLTAHSRVLAHFDGGDGRVALHGRGGASLADPLGTAASHGCVRLSNDAIEWIARRIGPATLPGTPVVIT